MLAEEGIAHSRSNLSRVGCVGKHAQALINIRPVFLSQGLPLPCRGPGSLRQFVLTLVFPFQATLEGASSNQSQMERWTE